MNYKNLKDKPSHTPRLVLVYGRWHCYTHNASGQGTTMEKAFKAWQQRDKWFRLDQERRERIRNYPIF